MRESIQSFSAFGWDFEIAFPYDEDGVEEIRRISRADDRGTGEISVEEGSDLEDQLITAVKALKTYGNFVDDVFYQMKEDSYEPDRYEDDYDDVGDAQSAKDDEMGQ